MLRWVLVRTRSVRSEVRSEVQSEVQSEVRSEVRYEVRSEVRSEIRPEVRSDGAVICMLRYLASSTEHANSMYSL